ncbi:hypothetical protein CU098_007768, partial [Rhizopus stolonifer]
MTKALLSLKPPVDSDPRLLSNKTKAVIIFCLGLCASTPGFASTIYFPGIPYITADLNAPSIATTLTAALYALFMGIAPIFWASLSDFYLVRRILILLSILIFGAASLGSAFINNIWGLVVLRCIQAVGASCGQSVGGGTIADIYPVEQRGAAFGKFYFGVFIGPLLGPIIGGFLIISDLTWRATFWFCFALAVMIFLILFFLLPETYRDDDQFDLNLSLANAKLAPIKRRINPIGPFLLLRHPFIFLSSFVSAIAFGCMFAVETIIPDLYEQHYGFNSWKTGLSYLGAGVGNLLGSILGGMLSDRLLLRSRRLRGGASVVEDRLTANLWPA